MPGIAGISFEGDKTEALKYVRAAKQHLERLQEYLKAGGIESGKFFRRLSDTAYCFVAVGMDVNIAHIVVAPGVDERKFISETVEREPDFLSGFIQRGYITADETGKKRVMDSLWPTTSCANLQNAFVSRTGQSKLVPIQPNKLERLAILPSDNFPELNAPEGSPTQYSQYALLKPGMYSGKMRAVIQALMGFGKQNRRSIYAKHKFQTEAEQKAARPDLPPTQNEKRVAQDGQQIEYDYRFFRTHGIVTGADGKLWLVEIGGTRGVLATPLPLYPHTTTQSFRDRLEHLSLPGGGTVPDLDGLRLLNLFGGYPNGEGFPITAAEIDAFVRAGVMHRLISYEDMQEFYENFPYSSAMGWAFSTSGHEAHNTSYNYEASGEMAGVQLGLHHSIAFQIGAMQVEDPEVTAQLKDLRDRIKRNLYAGRADFDKKHSGQSRRFEALLKKIERMDHVDLIAVRKDLGDDQAVGMDKLDARVLPPIATGTAHLSRPGRGYIFWPTKIQPQIKFPEPTAGYLMSHDLRPSIEGAGANPVCDTVMHVFFKGDDLQYVKFFRTKNAGGPDVPEIESTEESCMYLGEWSYQETHGPRHNDSLFYSNILDHREELPASTFIRKTKGERVGVTSVVVQDDPPHPNLGVLFRTHSFKMTVEIRFIPSEHKRNAITIPFYDREAYYYTLEITFPGQSKDRVVSYKDLVDPWTYDTWRNFPGYTGFLPAGCQHLSCWHLADHPSGCGKVLARTISNINYNAYACSEVADQGSWADICDDADAMVYGVQLPPTVLSSEPSDIRVIGNITLVNSTDFSPLTIRVGDFQPKSRWFRPSPDDFGVADFIASTPNALGTGEVLVYDSDIDISVREERKVRGASHPDLNLDTPTFIGVSS